MNIRLATVNDTHSILKIYSQYINTPISFEYQLPSLQEFKQRTEDIISEYPYLVYEENNEVVGYAYANRQLEREAYQWNAELSIYIDKSFTSKGFGKKMYSILIEILKLQGIKTVYGLVTVPNIKSEKLHTSLGFRDIGTCNNTGYKCGKWQNVKWFEKEISIYNLQPSPVIPINKISKIKIETTIHNLLYSNIEIKDLNNL